MRADVTHWKNTAVGGSRQGCGMGTAKGDKNKLVLLPLIPIILGG